MYESDDANQRLLSVTQHGGVAQKIPLDGVLAGDDAAATLIPIVHDRGRRTVSQRVVVHHMRDAIGGNASCSAAKHLPSGAGQTISRRMNRLALRLSIVIRDECGEGDE